MFVRDVATPPAGPPGPGGPTSDRPARAGRLADLVAEVAAVVEQLAPERCTAEQATALVEMFGELARLGEVGVTLSLARVDDTHAWRADGSRSARAWLARRLDIGVGDAGRRLEVAAGLRRTPDLERLVRSGAVSTAKLDDAVRTAAVAPGAEAALAAAATTESAKEFRATCLAHRLAAEDDEARHARHRRSRRVRHHLDGEGRFCVAASGPAAEGAEFLALFRPWHDQALRSLLGRGEAGQVDDIGGAAAWDALLAMARAAAGAGDARAADVPPSLRRPSGSRAKVIVRVDLPALRRGAALPHETCELSGVGPLDASTVLRLLDEGAFLAGVATSGDGAGGERVERVAHAGRHGDLASLPDLLARAPDLTRFLHPGRSPTATQRTALEWRYPTCSVEGCEMSVALDIDHTTPWADSHVTTVESLNARCRFHHRLKTAAENTARRQASTATHRDQPPRDDRRPAA
jgi:hypothetical protein